MLELEPEEGTDPRALNSVRHGLTSQRILDHEQAAYGRILRSMKHEYDGETAIERALIRRVARIIVRLDRAALIEQTVFADCFQDVTDSSIAEGVSGQLNHYSVTAFINTIHKYELALGRALVKTQHELERVAGKLTADDATVLRLVDFNW